MTSSPSSPDVVTVAGPDRAAPPTAPPAVPAPRDAGPDALADALVMDLLSERVPLSLLCDLGLPGSPRSSEICSSEGSPSEPWWAR